MPTNVTSRLVGETNSLHSDSVAVDVLDTTLYATRKSYTYNDSSFTTVSKVSLRRALANATGSVTVRIPVTLGNDSFVLSLIFNPTATDGKLFNYSGGNHFGPTLVDFLNHSLRSLRRNSEGFEPIPSGMAEGFEPIPSEMAQDFGFFTAMYNEAKASEARPGFFSAGIPSFLRGSDFTFGLEIEVDFPNYDSKQILAQRLYQEGLSRISSPAGWRYAARRENSDGTRGYQEDQNSWSVEFDRSVDDCDGNRGCELVSPILRDTEETWVNIAKVMGILKELGAFVSSRHGLHVNIGSTAFNGEHMTYDNAGALAFLQAKYDDVITRLATNSDASRNHRGRNYCEPFLWARNVGQASDFTRMTRSFLANYSMEDLHHSVIDLTKFRLGFGSEARVEFRVFDGTLDISRIQFNVMLAAHLVFLSKHNTVEELNGGPTVDIPPPGFRHSQNRSRRILTGTAWREDTELVRNFLSILKVSEAGYFNVIAVYRRSRWQ